MIEIKRWKSVTDREKWAARGASFVAKAKATKVVWFPPKPVETGKGAASTAKKATTRATKKTTGAAEKATTRATKKTTGAAEKTTTRATKKTTGAAEKATGAAEKATGAAEKATGVAKNVTNPVRRKKT
jgi:hypothetical protein